MKMTTIELKKITASEGMTLTNGEVYSKEIYLGCNDNPENWYEITDAEAEKRMAEQRRAEAEAEEKRKIAE